LNRFPFQSGAYRALGANRGRLKKILEAGT
jgi:hypothetical protein